MAVCFNVLRYPSTFPEMTEEDDDRNSGYPVFVKRMEPGNFRMRIGRSNHHATTFGDGYAKRE